MRRIWITIEINDPEVIEEYWETEDQIIFDDFCGQLDEVCLFEKVERVEK